MKRRGHAVQFPPGMCGVIGKFYNMLLDDGHVDSKLLGKVFDSCPSLYDKVHFMNAILLQPPTDQHREWIEAFGLAWIQSDNTLRYDHPERVPFVQNIGNRAVENFVSELDKAFENVTIVREQDEEGAASKKH